MFQSEHFIYSQPELKYEKQKSSAELRFGGQMCIKAYVHGKATVREAYQVRKTKRVFPVFVVRSVMLIKCC